MSSSLDESMLKKVISSSYAACVMSLRTRLHARVHARVETYMGLRERVQICSSNNYPHLNFSSSRHVDR